MREGFATIDEAAAFGALARRLIREENQLILIDKGGERIQLSDAQIRILQVKPEVLKKGMIGSEDDYLERNIPIYLFSEVKGLNGTFGSLSYGVLDKDSKPVKFDASVYHRKEKTFPSKACPPHDELIFIAPDPHLFARYWNREKGFDDSIRCQFWTDGYRIAVRKEDVQCTLKLLKIFKGNIVNVSDSD